LVVTVNTAVLPGAHELMVIVEVPITMCAWHPDAPAPAR